MHFIDVSIVYVLPHETWKHQMQIRRGATPPDLIELSGLLEKFPELELSKLKYGVYSKVVDQNYLLSNGDRLEIYRSLKSDPKTVRRELAKVGKTMTDNRD